MLNTFWTIVVVRREDRESEPIVISGRQETPRDLFEHLRFMRELPGVDMGLGEESSRVDLYENYEVITAFKGTPEQVPAPKYEDKASEERSEPSRIPIEELQGLAGRHVHFVGEFDDPWAVYTHTVDLHDWREHYTRFGKTDKVPIENSYFSVSELLDIEWNEMAERVDDLPVCVVMSGDLEMGLCPTSLEEGWQWSLIEAFTRLGVLPPTNDLYLSERMDLPRSPELVRYLLEAFRAGVAHEVRVKQSLAANTGEYLDKIAAKVLADN
jgi:hypothetical protein